MATMETQAARVSTNSFEKYGVQWPQGTPEALIEIICYRDGVGSPVEHLKKAVALLWPEVKQDYWFQTLADAWCGFNYLWLTGCASAGKTYGAALFTFVDWLADPTNAAAILTSTTVPALRVRVYGEAKRFWKTASTKMPGNLVDSSCRIESSKGDDKHAIRGIAVKDGPIEKAVGNIQGVHASRVMVVIDEMPQTPRAITVAASNLSKGATYFRMCGIGNAVGRYDAHGKACEPLLGWDSVTEDWGGWLTNDGICLHYDGLQSPNIFIHVSDPLLPVGLMGDVFNRVHRDTLKSISLEEENNTNRDRSTNPQDQRTNSLIDPTDIHVKANRLGLSDETKDELLTLQESMADAVNPNLVRTEYLKRLDDKVEYTHLIDSKQIITEKNRNTEDSLEWWSYVRGFWAPEGITRTVFSSNLLTPCMRRVTWDAAFQNVAFCDPAFEGGDRCVLTFGRMGIHATIDKMVLELQERYEIKPNMRDPKPIHFQLAEAIIEKLRQRGIQPRNYAMDTTGEGGGLADVIAQTWQPGFKRIEFGGAASEHAVSASDGRTCKEAYANRVTELWFDAKRYAQAGQIFGVDEDLINELCAREYQMEGKRYRIEKKEATKLRLGQSPDIADAFVVGAQLLRSFGPPGDITGTYVGNNNQRALRLGQENDVYSDGDFGEEW